MSAPVFGERDLLSFFEEDLKGGSRLSAHHQHREDFQGPACLDGRP